MVVTTRTESDTPPALQTFPTDPAWEFGPCTQNISQETHLVLHKPNNNFICQGQD